MRDPKMFEILVDADQPTEQELSFIRLVFGDGYSLAKAYRQIHKNASEATASVNGSKLFTRIMKKGWMQYAFDEAGATAALAIKKTLELIDAEDVVAVRRNDGLVDFFSTPNWHARAKGILILAKVQGLHVTGTRGGAADPTGAGKETFADRVRRQYEIMEQASSNGHNEK